MAAKMKEFAVAEKMDEPKKLKQEAGRKEQAEKEFAKRRAHDREAMEKGWRERDRRAARKRAKRLVGAREGEEERDAQSCH